jgi:predicted PurR-regulated permease PerM
VSANTRSNWVDAWTVARNVLIVVAVLASLWLIYELRTVLLLLVFSLLFAYLIAPLVEFIQCRLVFGRSRTLPPGLAIAIAYLAIVGVIAMSLTWVTPRFLDQISELAKQMPARLEAAHLNGEPFNTFYSRLERFGAPSTLVQRGVAAATSALDEGLRWVGAAFVRLAGYLPWLVLVPIFAFFLLKDAGTFRRWTIALAPSGRPRAHAAALLDRIDDALAAYIRAQLVAGLLIGAIVGVGFALFHVPYAAILGVAAGLAEFVPIIGPVMIALISAVVAGVHAPMLGVWVLVFLGILRVVEDYVIYPRLMGSNIHLHPLGVILAVLAGAELGGAIGVILSVPILAIAVAISRYFAESADDERRGARVRPA